MTIHLKAEDEQLIQRRLQSGIFEDAEEVMHDALAAQDAEETWLAQSRNEVSDKIARGIAQLDRGEGISGEEARDWLRQRK